MEEKDLHHHHHEDCDCGCEHGHTEDDVCDCGCEDAELVELTDDNGKVLKFYHIATLEYEDKPYAFFQAAEEIEGVDPDEVVIFEVSEKDGGLLPVEDEALLDKVFNVFIEEMEEDEE